MVRDLKVKAPFEPSGDQPKAIRELVSGFESGEVFQTLLGVTGSGKTFTVANVVEELNIPTLVLSHNKTLAAQLASEYGEFFPDNAVEYFVSYYDYYQPEAYVAKKDLYIEKDSSINEEIDRLRHKTTQSLMTRDDVIVVASVSCIFGLGSPEEYSKNSLLLGVGDSYLRRDLISRLVEMQYSRSESLERGSFRVRGNRMEICSIDEMVLSIDLFGDTIDALYFVDPVTGEVREELERALVFPATHYNISRGKMDQILEQIEKDMEDRVSWYLKHDRHLEAERIQQRTLFDIEMIRETGSVSGIENYSRYFDGRRSGEPPYTLLDFFPERYLMVIDESHVTIPQIRGMYKGDRSRKESLVEYGFRLPAALDNRPLTFPEFEKRLSLVLFTSATPGPWEKMRSGRTVEQIIRPTGLLDPLIEVRPVRGQTDDLVFEIRQRVEKGERALVTTLTKRMAEMLSEHLEELDTKVHYLHSDIKTLERVEILRDLRLGKYDVVVGINLLREGIDLPEVSLVAVLDADKEGFLRSETSLIQTIGRAARNVSGKVLMYADSVTPSMRRSIDETNRRRKLQEEHNREHGITPRTIVKEVRSIVGLDRVKEGDLLTLEEEEGDTLELLHRLEDEMHLAASELRFEDAALFRDRIVELKRKIK